MASTAKSGRAIAHPAHPVPPALYIPEDIWHAHQYTSNATQIAAAAVNAGVCLEDAASENNTFSTIGEAVAEVQICARITSM